MRKHVALTLDPQLADRLMAVSRDLSIPRSRLVDRLIADGIESLEAAAADSIWRKA